MSARNLEIVNLINSGLSHTEVGAKFGISSTRVRQIMTREQYKSKFLSEFNLDTHIDDIRMSARTYNCLMNEGHETLRPLLLLRDHQLLSIPNFGLKSLNEIKELIASAQLEA